MRKPEIERRFLLRPGFSKKDLPKRLLIRQYSIKQIYLKKVSKGISRRIRIIHDFQNNFDAYFFTEKQPTKNPAVKIENEREISRKEFEMLETEADLNRDPIFKRRACFKWKSQKFELDFFVNPERISSLAILEIELKRPEQKVMLPDFLPIATEITNSPDLSNSNLAKRPQ